MNQSTKFPRLAGLACIVLLLALLLPAMLPNSAAAIPAEPVVIYLETETTMTSSAASDSAVWSWNAYGTPTHAEVYVFIDHGVSPNSVLAVVQTSPDDTMWVQHTVPKGRDLDLDTDNGMINDSASTSDGYYYWDGPIHGRYFRVYWTLGNSESIDVTTVAILR